MIFKIVIYTFLVFLRIPLHLYFHLTSSLRLMSLKPIIKSAREALDRKDYPYALQLCTDALAFEPDNYWLLVFKAVALCAQEQNEAALVEYLKATKAQADNPTAFQVAKTTKIA